MNRTRVAKLWAEYRYRVGRARFDFDTEVKPEEFIELLRRCWTRRNHLLPVATNATPLMQSGIKMGVASVE